MSAEAWQPDDGEDVDNFPDRELRDWFDAELEARRGKVLLLKLSGATFATIAAECGISMSTARKDYRLALAAHMNETPETGIARHKAIIMDVLRANYPAMLSGDKDAAQTILKALDRDAKMSGYDAPTRVLAAVSDREFANEAARLIGRIQQLDPDTLKELTRVHRPQRPILEGEVIEPPAPRPDEDQQRGGAGDDDALAGWRSSLPPVEQLGLIDYPPAAPADPAMPDPEDWPRYFGVEFEVEHRRKRPASVPGELDSDAAPAEPGPPDLAAVADGRHDGGGGGQHDDGPVRPAGDVDGGRPQGRAEDRAVGVDPVAGHADPDALDDRGDDDGDDLDGWSNID